MKYFFLDHLVLVGMVVAVSLLLILYPVGPLMGSILYFALPSAYLVFKKPCIFKTAVLPSLIFGFLYGVGFEYINEVGGSWIFPRAGEFVFPNLFLV